MTKRLTVICLPALLLLAATGASAQTTPSGSLALHFPNSSAPTASHERTLRAAEEEGNGAPAGAKQHLSSIPNTTAAFGANKAGMPAVFAIEQAPPAQARPMSEELQAWVERELATQQETARRYKRR